MSGHSKWHNIRLRKGKQDAERGKVFTKLAREIIMAAKGGGPNPDANLRLRLAIQKARENSMPQDNIKRAIERGSGAADGSNYDEVTYEGYGPGGVAVLVDCLTDNRNRTVPEIRHIFNRNGGQLGESGCVSWNFDACGVVTVSINGVNEDAIMEAALEAGAQDVRAEEEIWEVITSPTEVHSVREALEKAGINVDSADQTMLPKTTVKLEGKEAQQMIRLMELLEDHDDVQQAYANFDIEESLLQAAA